MDKNLKNCIICHDYVSEIGKYRDLCTRCYNATGFYTQANRQYKCKNVYLHEDIVQNEDFTLLALGFIIGASIC